MRLFFLFFLLVSCGYRLLENDKNVSLQYVKGDEKGIFTKELVYALSSLGFDCSENADYVLDVSLENIQDNVIGYRFDRENDGRLKKNIMATENRKKIDAKISLISKKDRVVIWGPYVISACVDYDYVTQDSIRDLSFILPSGRRESVLAFSLGQLESIDSASNGALNSLYKILAKKVARAIEKR